MPNELKPCEERAVEYVSQRLKMHPEVVARFYKNRHSKHIFNENEVVGVLVERVAVEDALVETLKDCIAE